MGTLASTFQALKPVQIAALAAVAAALLAGFVFLSGQIAGPDMALLYGELDSEDSNRISARLGQLGVDYDVSPDGTAILVPRPDVARLRVAMAEEGLPSGGSVGYEVFDEAEGLGTTSFVQNLNHLRALEGELARTIKSIEYVKNARVHLVLPRRELFSRQRQEPSASIVVSMQGNRRLDRSQVLAIQHLVATAVPGLDPKRISLVDNQGTLLARGQSEDGEAVMATNAEEMRVSYEERLASTIVELLERSVGYGNVRAEVTAEMDFDRMTENSETYDPEGQVVRSTQTVEESDENSDGEPAPVTVGNNLPDPTTGLGQGLSNSRSNRIEETVNYEISRTVTTHVREAGLVRRLSIAVLVNGNYAEGENGERLYEPRSAEEMEQLGLLVRSAVGFDDERGDQLEIANLRFLEIDEQFVEDDPLALFGMTRDEVIRIAELLVLGLVGLVVILTVIRPLMARVVDASREMVIADTPALAGAEAGGGAAALPGAAGGQALLTGPGRAGGLPAPSGADGEQMIDLSQVEGRVRSSSLRKVAEIVEKHPEESVAFLRNWIYAE